MTTQLKDYREGRVGQEVTYTLGFRWERGQEERGQLGWANGFEPRSEMGVGVGS